MLRPPDSWERDAGVTLCARCGRSQLYFFSPVLFQAQLQDFLQVTVEFVEVGGLGVRSGDTGDDADVQVGLRVILEVSAKCSHGSQICLDHFLD